MDRFSRLQLTTVLFFILTIQSVPALAERDYLVGAGPNIGLWDVGDGQHVVGLYSAFMVHFGPEDGSVSSRLDVAYSQFWGDGNANYNTTTLLASMVVTPWRDSNARPYWTLGTGIDVPSDSSAQLIFGSGIGVRLNWGAIEGRINLAGTSGGVGAYVPIFAALSF